MLSLAILILLQHMIIFPLSRRSTSWWFSQVWKIQYFYTQFNKYGAETPFSGLSELVPLSSGDRSKGLSSFVGDLPNQTPIKLLQLGCRY